MKDTIAEMEFEPKTMPAPPPPTAPAAVHWFLMPVQGWFVLSIILAALVVVLGVGSALLYSSLRKQKRKVRRQWCAQIIKTSSDIMFTFF